MKKLLASILLLVYFAVSTGFVVSVHYCMNKVDSVAFGDESADVCGKCGMHVEDSGGCCKDDVKLIKMQVDQSFAKVAVPDFSLLPLFSTYLPEADALAGRSMVSYPLAHGPPLSYQDSYLLHCVFRI